MVTVQNFEVTSDNFSVIFVEYVLMKTMHINGLLNYIQ